MSESMYALVKSKAEKGLWLEKIPIPKTGANDVKIQITKTSICGTDLHIYNWDMWSQRNIAVPMNIGHEFVGRIVEVGSNVEGFEVGEQVSGEGHLVCGKCRNCLAGRRHLCKDTKGVGISYPGAFAQYLVIPYTNVWKCSHNIPEELYACFDPLGNATHTALCYDLVGEDVLITGAGPIGMMTAAICRHVGARHVVVSDVNDYRLSLAKEMGATVTVNVTKKSLREVMEEIGMKEGFDVGMEMSGNPVALKEMIDLMYHGGKIALLGIPGQDVNIDWDKVVFNGLTIRGIYGREMYETWYKMSTMLESGLDISKVITHRFSALDFEKGFEAMQQGNSGKVVLNWEGVF